MYHGYLPIPQPVQRIPHSTDSTELAAGTECKRCDSAGNPGHVPRGVGTQLQEAASEPYTPI